MSVPALTIQGEEVSISQLIGPEFQNFMGKVRLATERQVALKVSSHDCFLLEHTVNVMLEIISSNIQILSALQKSGALLVENTDDEPTANS